MKYEVIAREWLKASQDDLLLISEILHNPLLTHMVAFHAQQSVEKTLKALAEFHGMTPPRKHDLLMLSGMVHHVIPISDADMLDTLNSLYIEARYPGELGLLPNGKPTLDEARRFYDFARQLHAQATRLLDDIY